MTTLSLTINVNILISPFMIPCCVHITLIAQQQ